MREFKLTIAQKKHILSRFIQLLVHTGYDIKPYIYRPLSYWDYFSILEEIEQIAKEHNLDIDNYIDERILK